MGTRIIKKLKIGESANKKISLRLVKEIIKVKNDLQREENIRRGRKAKVITFVFASDMLAKRFKQ